MNNDCQNCFNEIKRFVIAKVIKFLYEEQKKSAINIEDEPKRLYSLVRRLKCKYKDITKEEFLIRLEAAKIKQKNTVLLNRYKSASKAAKSCL